MVTERSPPAPKVAVTGGSPTFTHPRVGVCVCGWCGGVCELDSQFFRGFCLSVSTYLPASTKEGETNRYQDHPETLSKVITRNTL